MLFFLSMVVVILQSLTFARMMGYIALPGEVSQGQRLRLALEGELSYYRDLAEKYRVSDSAAVLREIERMDSALAKVRTSKDAHGVMAVGGQVDTAIRTAVRERMRGKSEAILKADPAVSTYGQEAELLVVKQGGEVVVHPTDDSIKLKPTTITKLNELPGLDIEPLYFRLTHGKVTMISQRDLLQTGALLMRENRQLRQVLQTVREQVGSSEVSGRGIVAEASDAPGGYLWVQIVHERDIREIVNSLFGAGAEAVQIGSERFGATSWVRCVGPVVVVNGRQVAANPITVQAVGDPARLKASLSDLRREFELTQKHLDIREVERLTLNPYRIPGT